ncbi:S24 family peptidase [Salinarimonas ramus]|uniref:DNA-binding protein n=1 Tax=Salinarimonas ramus TaxID=690164 RepID=A0A917Q9U0_9HYPH|nr:helix-turn-helix transcriptional regulator [Salinarimonas ramus]GGK37182.1 DNA-binding protein [Salinarimonas ramus]
MLTHGQIWMAIDRLAERYGLTASGLARRAGLDATSFNRSKRVSPDGRERWPSTESIAKVLNATGAGLDEFTSLIEPGEPKSGATVPIVGWRDAGAPPLFAQDGMPSGARWDEIEFPDVGSERVFAVEVAGGAHEPVYRDGDVLIVSPSAGLRKGDRVLVRDAQGKVSARELVRRTVRTLEVKHVCDGGEASLPVAELEYVARIMWCKQ